MTWQGLAVVSLIAAGALAMFSGADWVLHRTLRSTSYARYLALTITTWLIYASLLTFVVAGVLTGVRMIQTTQP